VLLPDRAQLLTGIQEGAGFIADEDEEDEEEEARRERRRRKKRKNREADEALDDEDLDLIGVEIEKPEETQVGWLPPRHQVSCSPQRSLDSSA
jgi:hypothetical protein